MRHKIAAKNGFSSRNLGHRDQVASRLIQRRRLAARAVRCSGMKAWDSLNRRIINCERCPRLRQYCGAIAKEKRRSFADWNYWGRPVPNFGTHPARLLVVGLAPAAHGG